MKIVQMIELFLGQDLLDLEFRIDLLAFEVVIFFMGASSLR